MLGMCRYVHLRVVGTVGWRFYVFSSDRGRPKGETEGIGETDVSSLAQPATTQRGKCGRHSQHDRGLYQLCMQSYTRWRSSVPRGCRVWVFSLGLVREVGTDTGPTFAGI